MRGTERERQRQKQAPCSEPDVGLDPGTPGSRPGPKAGAKPLSHPGIPLLLLLEKLLIAFWLKTVLLVVKEYYPSDESQLVTIHLMRQ